jgi:hypothetical protein
MFVLMVLSWGEYLKAKEHSGAVSAFFKAGNGLLIEPFVLSQVAFPVFNEWRQF